jgi:hypothetical protein
MDFTFKLFSAIIIFQASCLFFTKFAKASKAAGIISVTPKIARGRMNTKRRHKQTTSREHTHNKQATKARQDTTRHDTTRHDTTRHDTTRHDTTKQDNHKTRQPQDNHKIRHGRFKRNNTTFPKSNAKKLRILYKIVSEKKNAVAEKSA